MPMHSASNDRSFCASVNDAYQAHFATAGFEQLVGSRGACHWPIARIAWRGHPLANPTLELRDSQGALIVSNDDWQQGSDSTTISKRGLAPKNSKESAVFAIPPPGDYTAIIRGVDKTVGVGLVEVYQLQVSARGQA